MNAATVVLALLLIAPAPDKVPARRIDTFALPYVQTGTVEAQSAVWSIDSAAVFEIGAAARDEADQLGRVMTARRLSDGSIAILDAMQPAVRIYDARGRHVRDVGRSGDGPGEFRVPLALEIVADTIVVLDEGGRIIRFSASGDELRTDRMSLEGLFDPRFNGVYGGLLSDGSVLVLGKERLFGRVTGEYRQRVGMIRMRNTGAPDTIGWFAADSIRTDRAGVPVPRPYTPASGLLWSAAGDRIFVVTADRPILYSFARDGSAAGRARVPLRGRPVTDADVAEFAADVLRRASTANDRRVIAEWVEGLPRSRRTPLVRSIVAVNDNEVWLESWNHADGRSDWLIMSNTGVRARATAPARCRLLSVGDDWVLCLWRDLYDVERVRLHRLRRVGP